MCNRHLAMAAVVIALLVAGCGDDAPSPARSPAASFNPTPTSPPPTDPLVDVAVKEVQVALDEARAAGHVGPCRVVHVRVEAEAEKRSWANPEQCRIEMDSSVTRAGGWWFRYQARHEVAHIVTRSLDHHDQRFRCVESTLVAQMGQQLVYGDDPEGYPVRIQEGSGASPPAPCRDTPDGRHARRPAL
jgi:hypothetical protein